MTKLIVVAAGYEGVTNTYVVKGKDRCDCLKKVYMEAKGYDEDDYDEYELAEMKTLTEEDWLEKLNSDFDTADFVPQTIFDVGAGEFIFEDNMGNGYII